MELSLDMDAAERCPGERVGVMGNGGDSGGSGLNEESSCVA